jgi:hypothetical protein
MWMRSRRTILLDVTADGLTVNGLPGTVFPFTGAQLGPWARMGVALHLQSGSRRFVLGARDRRIAPSTRLDAPAVSAVDGWLWASDFDELLAIGGPRSGVDVRGPAQAEPTRCLLFPNPYLAEEFGSMAFRRHLRFQRSRPQPSLFVDVDGDAIRVIDPHSNAPGASAWVTQVTATPATFQPDSVTSGDGSTYSYPAIGGLIVCFPGTQPLTIGCLDRARSQFRFCWSAGVPRANQRADYVVSGGDWLTLVERFGLTAHLQDRATPEDRR